MPRLEFVIHLGGIRLELIERDGENLTSPGRFNLTATNYDDESLSFDLSADDIVTLANLLRGVR